MVAAITSSSVNTRQRGYALSIYDDVRVYIELHLTAQLAALTTIFSSSLCGGSECVYYVCSSLHPSTSSGDKNAVVAGPADPWSAVRQTR